MTLPRHITAAAAAIALAAVHAHACDPWDRFETYELCDNTVSRFHFYQGDSLENVYLLQMNENVDLWRRATSADLPDSCIIQGVYRITLDSLRAELSRPDAANPFLRWINAQPDTGLGDYLLLAKELEEMREHRVSPWYHPTDKNGFDAVADEQARFQSILDRCRAQRRGPLSDRYGLQAVRALMATERYQECIDYYNQNLSRLPDTNLFKRMAAGYAAGCHRRLGDSIRAEALYATAGDFVSMNSPRQFEIMAARNPDSEMFKTRLNGYIGYGDSAENMRYYRMADIALSSPRVKHRADWLYLKSYIEHHFRHNDAAALRYARAAMRHTFSTPQMRDDARMFILCYTPAAQLSIDDIQWMTQRLPSALWVSAIPELMRRGQTTKALVLANYDLTPDAERVDYEGRDCHTWANAAFQLMLSCSVADVERYVRELRAPTMALTRALAPRLRSDEPYLSELLGTLCLREGQYAKAAEYFEKVPVDYQKKMNVYIDRHLSYDPWGYYYTTESKWDHPRYRWESEYSIYPEAEEYGPDLRKSKVQYLKTQDNAKLLFAREMARLDTIMRADPDPNARALARLRSAIGRYNSLNTCWALTQYWLGASNQCRYDLAYTYEHGRYSLQDFIHPVPRQLKGIGPWFENEVLESLAQMSDPETQAEAALMMRNYLTIAKHYPDTPAARQVAARCDKWKDWL